MRGRRPARPRTAIIVLLMAALIGGCGGSAEGTAKLRIYLSAPLSGPGAGDGRDVADGAKLALADAGGEAAGVPVSLRVLDDADEEGWDGALSAANARRAAEDSTTIAYIGEVDSGASRASVPISNEASILQVSPGAGAEDLTSDVPGGTAIPSLVQPSGARTFGRVIPSDRVQGEAAGAWMSREGVRSVAVAGAGEPFGASLSDGIASASPAPAIVDANDDPDALYLAHAGLGPDLPFINSEETPLFGSDALLRDLRSFSSIKLTSAALDPAQLPPQAEGFLNDFEAEYNRPPGRLAAYGYEGMAVVLDSIGRADDPLDRRSVIDAFFATSDRGSILGTYSIDPVGNTTLGELGAYEVREDRLKPAREPIEAG